MEKKINLEEILKKELIPAIHANNPDLTFNATIRAMRNACSQILKLAAENAILTHDEDVDHHFVENFPKNLYFEYQGFPESVSINEQSILDTIKQVE